MKKCAGCEAKFVPATENPGQRFHNHKCFLAHNNRNSERQQSKGKKGGKTRGQQRTELAKAEGYKGYVKEPGTERGQHCVVAERVLCRFLTQQEVVHHEDLNKANNNPANLIVFANQAEHAKHHGNSHLGQDTCTCECIRLREVMPNAHTS